MKRYKFYSVLRLTPGQFHCWCDTSIGVIKKENKNVPDRVWNRFMGIVEHSWWEKAYHPISYWNEEKHIFEAKTLFGRIVLWLKKIKEKLWKI